MLDLNKNELARSNRQVRSYLRCRPLNPRKLFFVPPTRRSTSSNVFTIRAANRQESFDRKISGTRCTLHGIHASATFPTIGPFTKFRLNFLIGGYAGNRVSGCDWSTNRTRSGKVVGNCCLRGVASGYVTQTRNYVARNFDVKTVTRFFDVSLMLIIRSDRSAAGWSARRNLGAAFLDLRGGGTLQPNGGEARLDAIV